MEWNELIIVVSVLLALLLIWKELIRAKRSMLLLRLLASLLAVFSLACLLLPISYPRQVRMNTTQKILFLTEGADPDSVKAYLTPGRLTVFTNDPTTAKAFKQLNPKIVSTLDPFLKTQPKTTIELFGYGLKSFELESLADAHLNFHPSPLPAGIEAVDWPRWLSAGDKLVVQGRYRNPEARPLKVILTAFNHPLDSIEIRSSQETFELSTWPKHSGRAVYSLIAVSGKDTLTNDPLPVFIEPARPHKVLILSSSPDFEMKFLRNWLAENQYEISSRTRISKEKFDQSFINARKADLQNIAPQVLASADVIIADDRELNALTGAERQTIRRAVERDGAGLIIRTDSTLKNSFYSHHFPVRQTSVNATERIPVQLLAEKPIGTLQAEAAAAFIIPRAGTQPLLTDHKGKVFANRMLFGTGTVLVTTLQNTYQFILEEKKDQYAQLWSSIISTTIKKERKTTQWILPNFPRKDEPTLVRLSATAQGTPKVNVGHLNLPPEQDERRPYLWQVVFWPEKSGWEELKTGEERPNFMFIYAPNTWKSVDYAERLRATGKATSKNRPIADGDHLVNQRKEVPKIYFFLLLLVTCGSLWYETKFL